MATNINFIEFPEISIHRVSGCGGRVGMAIQENMHAVVPNRRDDNEVQRLLYELQVHRLELERQNAELSQTRDEVETAPGIVKRHGGRVWAESEPGQSAAFFFTLGIWR